MRIDRLQGHAWLLPLYHSGADDEARIVARLKAASVPIVLTEDRATYDREYRPVFEQVDKYLREHYVDVGEIGVGDAPPLRVLAHARIAASGRMGLWSSLFRGAHRPMILEFDQLRDYRGRVAMVDGAFDPLHRGHIEYFRAAAAAVDVPLLCNVASDRYVSTSTRRYCPRTNGPRSSMRFATSPTHT